MKVKLLKYVSADRQRLERLARKAGFKNLNNYLTVSDLAEATISQVEPMLRSIIEIRESLDDSKKNQELITKTRALKKLVIHLFKLIHEHHNLDHSKVSPGSLCPICTSESFRKALGEADQLNA